VKLSAVSRTAAPRPAVGVLLTLWRATVAFRIVAFLFCAYLIIRWRDLYAEPAVAYGVGAAMAAVTVVLTALAVTGRAHRLSLVAVDLIGCIVLTLLTRLAQHADQFHGGMLTLTSVWAAGPVIEAGLVLGAAGGAAAGLLQFAASVVVRDGYDGRTLANGFILLIVGSIAGYLATVTVRVERERAAAAAERARFAERERVTRSIHDGVLQVLALVHRRGMAVGGEWTELAEEAAAQEAALRALINARPAPLPTPGHRDLGAELAALGSTRRVVSLPEAPVMLPDAVAGEVLAAVREVVRNIDAHAGADAIAWVFVEDDGEEVTVTVRDNGAGMSAGRLDEAAAEGRLGIVASVRGRVADLGGQVRITSAPGEGTEVEIAVPRGRS
jgi:signal transduction histidine kinase